MKSILLLSILVIILWGLWAFLFKAGVNEIGIKSALIWNNIVALGISILIIAFLIPSEGLKFSNGAIFIIIATIFGFLGTIIWYFGLEEHKASLIVSFTALYPLVTVILASLFLKEKLSIANAIGIALAVTAGILLSL